MVVVVVVCVCGGGGGGGGGSDLQYSTFHSSETVTCQKILTLTIVYMLPHDGYSISLVQPSATTMFQTDSPTFCIGNCPKIKKQNNSLEIYTLHGKFYTVS